VPINGFVEITLTSDGCDGDVTFLEHVDAVVTLSASVRGQVGNEYTAQMMAWWLCVSAVERQSLASVFSPSCARPVADG